jgi:hypothetical protein
MAESKQVQLNNMFILKYFDSHASTQNKMRAYHLLYSTYLLEDEDHHPENW